MKPLSPLLSSLRGQVPPRFIPWLDYFGGLRVADYPGARLIIIPPLRIVGVLLWVIGLIPWLLAAKVVLPGLVHGHSSVDNFVFYGVLAVVLGWMVIPGLRLLQNEHRLLLTRPQLQWRYGPLPWPRQQALAATDLRAAAVRTTVSHHKTKNGKAYTTSEHALMLTLRNGSEIIPFGHVSENSARHTAEAICDWYRLECRTENYPGASTMIKGQRLAPGAQPGTLLGFSTGTPHLAVPLLALLLTAGGVELWSESWSVDLWRKARTQAVSEELEAAKRAVPQQALTLDTIYPAESGLAKGATALGSEQPAALPALEAVRQHLRTGLTAEAADALLSPLINQQMPRETFQQRFVSLRARELAPAADLSVWISAYSHRLWLQSQAELLPLLGMESPKKEELRRAEQALRVLEEPIESDFGTLQIVPVLLDPPLAVALFYAPDDTDIQDPLLLVGWLMFEQSNYAAGQTRVVAEAYLRAFPHARSMPVQPLLLTQTETERDAEIARVLAESHAAVLNDDREALLALLHPVAATMLRTTSGWDEWLTAQMAALKPQMQTAYDIGEQSELGYFGERIVRLTAQGLPPTADTTPKGYALFSYVDSRWVLRDLIWGETALLRF